MPLTIGLNDGPPDKASVGDAYAGKPLPASLVALMENRITCPSTGNLTSQEDYSKVFLAPIP
jgi:hypothetical protein